jgi:hypothetical protein
MFAQAYKILVLICLLIQYWLLLLKTAFFQDMLQKHILYVVLYLLGCKYLIIEPMPMPIAETIIPGKSILTSGILNLLKLIILAKLNVA